MPSRIAFLASLIVTLSGCSLFGDKSTGGPVTAALPESGASVPSARMTDLPAAGRTSGARSLVSGLVENTVRFDFDATDVQPEYHATLDRWAAYLRNHPKARIRLEGHTDERGTREYNMALGERRSIAVREYLIARGISPEQLGVVTYGEEEPLENGHHAEAWRQNRRVELVD